MSDPIREMFQSPFRAEPSVGDAYGRFVHRRRRRRGMRILTGFLVGAVVTVGFVQVYPGVDGGVPSQGFIPGSEVDPAMGAIREHSQGGVTVRYPSSWSLDEGEGQFRLTQLLPADSVRPGGVEVRFGPACDGCFWPARPTEPVTYDTQGGVVVEPTTIRAGSVRSEAVLMRYPADVSNEGLKAPWCETCVMIRYETPLGRALPVWIVGPTETAIRQAEDEIAFILASIDLEGR